MIIKILLLFLVILIFLYFISKSETYRIKAWKKLLALFFTFFATIAIITPNIVSDLARFVNVGRGTDLLLYMLTISFIFVSANTYINNQKVENQLTKIIRLLALYEAQNDSHNKKISKNINHKFND